MERIKHYKSNNSHKKSIYTGMMENKYRPGFNPGRSKYVIAILRGKGGRLCSNELSPAAQFVKGRSNLYAPPWVYRMLGEFSELF